MPTIGPDTCLARGVELVLPLAAFELLSAVHVAQIVDGIRDHVMSMSPILAASSAFSIVVGTALLVAPIFR